MESCQKVLACHFYKKSNLKIRSILFFFLWGLVFTSCNGNVENSSEDDLLFQMEIGKCYSNPKALIENDTIVEDCLKSLIDNYPNRIEGYLFLCELLHERKSFNELVALQDRIYSKFKSNSKFLFQKNYFLMNDSTDFNKAEVNLLIDRKHKGELSDQEIKDLDFFFEYLKLNKSKIEDLEKRKFVDSYFK